MGELAHRFWAKVQKTDGCWLWTGARNNKGYGLVRVSGNLVLVHRLSYESAIGPIPPELQIDHLCRVRLCVRPTHLEPVTGKENIRRGAGHGHETECPRGHPYDEANTYIRKNGSRNCRACQPARRREASARS